MYNQLRYAKRSFRLKWSNRRWKRE